MTGPGLGFEIGRVGFGTCELLTVNSPIDGWLPVVVPNGAVGWLPAQALVTS